MAAEEDPAELETDGDEGTLGGGAGVVRTGGRDWDGARE